MKGDVFLLKGGDGQATEVFTLLDALRATGYQINGEMIDATSKDSQEWRELLAGGVKSLSITAEGVWKATTEQKALRTHAIDGTLRNYQLDDSDSVIEGAFKLTNFGVQGDHGDVQTYSVTLESADVPTVT